MTGINPQAAFGTESDNWTVDVTKMRSISTDRLGPCLEVNGRFTP